MSENLGLVILVARSLTTRFTAYKQSKNEQVTSSINDIVVEADLYPVRTN